jgi:hypothetical protein
MASVIFFRVRFGRFVREPLRCQEDYVEVFLSPFVARKRNCAGDAPYQGEDQGSD